MKPKRLKDKYNVNQLKQSINHYRIKLVVKLTTCIMSYTSNGRSQKEYPKGIESTIINQIYENYEKTSTFNADHAVHGSVRSGGC